MVSPSELRRSVIFAISTGHTATTANLAAVSIAFRKVTALETCELDNMATLYAWQCEPPDMSNTRIGPCIALSPCAAIDWNCPNLGIRPEPIGFGVA